MSRPRGLFGFPVLLLALLFARASGQHEGSATRPAAAPEDRSRSPRTWDDPPSQSGLVFGHVDGRELRLDLYRPMAVKNETPLPCVVLVHGGGWRMGNRAHLHDFGIALTWRGYVAAAVDYRLVQEAPFPACIEDVKCAVRWLRANAERLGIDPARIGALGLSAGGHLASLLGATGDDLWNRSGGSEGRSARVQAVVSFFGPEDLRGKGATEGPGRMVYDLFGGPESERGDAYRVGSPIVHVTPDDCPFLFLHGEADPLVPIEQSERMKAALDRAHVPATLIRVRNGVHGYDLHRGWVPRDLSRSTEPDSESIERALLDFLDRWVRDAPASRPGAR
jgi:acetyl esterase/lipase